MTYKTGSWGNQAKERSKRRRKYFLDYIDKKGAHRGLGYLGELEATIILKGSSRNYKGIDLDWNGKKIDVKTSSFHDWYSRWTFWLKKQRGKCDYFLLLCKDLNGKTLFIFLIPDKEIQENSLIIKKSELSLFEKYAVKVR